MTKFKNGDKVIIKGLSRYGRDYIGKIGEVKMATPDNDGDIKVAVDGSVLFILPSKVELLDLDKCYQTNKLMSEIKDLKSEVNQLKLAVEELKKNQSKTAMEIANDLFQELKKSIDKCSIIEFEGNKYKKVNREAQVGDVVVSTVESTPYVEKGKVYKVEEYIGLCCVNVGTKNVIPLYHGERKVEDVDVYELIEENQKTPNQLRKEIIEKAKKFIKLNRTDIEGLSEYNKVDYIPKIWKNVYKVINKQGRICACDVEFIVNREKQKVTALLRGVDSKKVYSKGVAKCLDSDVFNEDIGKAIALGRALGLDVSEFENAVNPDIYENGQVITFPRNDSWYRKTCYEIVNKESYESLIVVKHSGDKNDIGRKSFSELDENCKLEIIEDSNAKY